MAACAGGSGGSASPGVTAPAGGTPTATASAAVPIPTPRPSGGPTTVPSDLPLIDVSVTLDLAASLDDATCTYAGPRVVVAGTRLRFTFDPGELATERALVVYPIEPSAPDAWVEAHDAGGPTDVIAELPWLPPGAFRHWQFDAGQMVLVLEADEYIGTPGQRGYAVACAWWGDPDPGYIRPAARITVVGEP